MNLQPINPPLENGRAVICSWCARRIATGGMADLDGRAFVDYYCDDCSARMAVHQADIDSETSNQ